MGDQRHDEGHNRHEDECCRESKVVLQEIRAVLRKMDERQERQVVPELKSIVGLLTSIKELLTPSAAGVPTEMKLKFGQGDPDMAGQETDVQTIPCSAIETDADGNPVTLNPATATWEIDALPDGSALATILQNSDDPSIPAGSVKFKALKVGGPVNISCTDSSVTPPLVGTNTLQVVSSTKTPSSMALVFGDPQAATA